MIVIPALDLRGGKCVRMERGDPSTVTVFANDPIEQAKKFVSEGARRLHIADLDAALGNGNNLDLVQKICAAAKVPVQVGGGVRTIDHAQRRFDAGASEVIVGTLLVNDERAARSIIARFGERVIAAIDARGKLVATHGWRENTPVDRDALVRRVAQWGIGRVIFTEIRRIGMGGGFDVDALRAVASAAEIKVTAQGGGRTIDDLRILEKEAPPAVDSCIVGSALYKGTIKLRDAIAALA